jgi:hypothetical protein
MEVWRVANHVANNRNSYCPVHMVDRVANLHIYPSRPFTRVLVLRGRQDKGFAYRHGVQCRVGR